MKLQLKWMQNEGFLQLKDAFSHPFEGSLNADRFEEHTAKECAVFCWFTRCLMNSTGCARQPFNSLCNYIHTKFLGVKLGFELESLKWLPKRIWFVINRIWWRVPRIRPMKSCLSSDQSTSGFNLRLPRVAFINYRHERIGKERLPLQRLGLYIGWSSSEVAEIEFLSLSL